MTTNNKRAYSSLSCVSLPSLPTITEERSQPNRTRLYPKKEPKHLCAVFDFESFVLDSSLLTEDEIVQKRKLSPDLAITNMGVQEYINKRINTTITLIVIPPRIIKKLKTSRIPCLGKKKSIYITKYKNKKDGEFYMKLSTIKPSKENKNKDKNLNGTDGDSSDNAIKCALNGMVFAIIFSTFPSTKRFIINGVYYHGHGSPVYKPNFDGREKDLRACKPYDIFLPDTQNAIKTLKPFKRKRAKSCNGYNVNTNANPIAMVKNEESARSRSRNKQRTKRGESFKLIKSKKATKPKTRKQKSCPEPSISRSPFSSSSKRKTSKSRSTSSTSPIPRSTRSKSPSSSKLRSKSPNKSHHRTLSKSPKPTKSLSKAQKRKRGKSDSLSTLNRVSLNQGKRKTLKQKKVSMKKVRVSGEGLDLVKPSLNHSTSINSVLSVSLSPIKESKVMRMRRNGSYSSLNKLQKKRNEQRS